MFKFARKPSYLFGFWPLSKQSPHDEISDSEKSAVKSADEDTGWGRLRIMFTRNEFEEMSPELNSVYQASFLGLFIGSCYGGIVHSRTAYIDFMERNEATMFKSHLDAKRKLQDTVTMSFAKGAFKWGWRLGLFTGAYVLFTTTVSVYRGRSSLLEYVAAGGITGAVYKCNLGLRGIAVGGGLGSVLGGMAGLASLGILKASGMTMEEIRFWQQEWSRTRRTNFKKPAESTDEILFVHRTEEGKGLESIPAESIKSQ